MPQMHAALNIQLSLRKLFNYSYLRWIIPNSVFVSEASVNIEWKSAFFRPLKCKGEYEKTTYDSMLEK